jgi:DNA-binding PadR family transcriptional regulator
LLSFWILLLLDNRPTYAFEMNPLIRELSQGTISADENSLYRALNRFEQLGIISSQPQPSELGPTRRYYSLTDAGRDLLSFYPAQPARVSIAPGSQRHPGLDGEWARKGEERMIDTLEQQLEKWKKVLLVYLGRELAWC